MKNRYTLVKNKIFLLFIFVIITSLSAVGWFGFISAKDSYIDSALLINKGETKALSNNIKGLLGTIPDDVIYNSNFYALKKLLVWEDLEEKKKIDKWKNEYISALKDYLENKNFYYQVRLLDMQGYEKVLLKYDTSSNKVIQTPDDRLQNKAHKDYFKKATTLNKGEFYISSMDLNVEYGQIEKPFVPVVRYSTPIIDENGEKKGVLVLNFNANNILDEIAAVKALDKKSDTKKYFLINKEGYYLYTDEKNKRWGFQVGSNYNFQKDYKGVMDRFKDQESITIREKQNIFSMDKIYPNKIDNEYRYWYLVTVIDENIALLSLSNFITIFTLLLIGVLALGLLIINSYISKLINPLSSVTKQLKALSRGEIKKEQIEYRADDEIGEIVQSTSILVDAIETTINQANAVAGGDFSKEITLLSKNDQLGLALRDMTKRLKEITDLAKSLSKGDYDINIMVKSGEDELGLALIDMVKYLESITIIAESISMGNIDVKYKAASSRDRLGYAILQMTKYLKNILKQSNLISKGDFSNTIEPKAKSDELGIALVSMTNMLRENSQKNKDEIWLGDGLGNLSDTLSGINDIKTLSKEALSLMSRYTKVSSAVAYIYDKKKNSLDQIGTFAFRFKEDISESFDIGEGIVGQVALEKKEILVKNIEDTQLQIQSGTTISKPKQIFAIPLIYEDELYGVVEFMSFEEFDKLKEEYLLKASKIFTTTLFNTIQNDKIKSLLQESQNSFEKLQAKSEEMEIQSEELRASNEQMEYQQEQLEKQSEDLQLQNKEIEKTKKQIEQKATDLETSNRYKSEFLANMSHELRTPLNSVILLSSLLSKNKNANLSNDDIKKTKVINESGNELLRLIDDILDLSKIESGKMELIVDKIDSKETLRHYEELFSHTAKSKGLEFSVIDNIGGVFYNDKNRLGQVIRNFISNALKFTKFGSVTLKFEKISDTELPIKISVIDTGIGIQEQKQELIFKAFMQADGSTSREFGGTGLGLSISKELAHLMKGKIELVSKEQVGSIFSLSLPSLEKEYQNIEPKSKLKSTIDDRYIKKVEPVNYLNQDIDILNEKKVLIVDDDVKNIFVLTTALEEYNMEVSYAKNGQEALDFLRKNLDTDIVLMDIMMPIMDGYEAIKHIKKDSKLKDLKIIAVSAKAMQTDMNEAFYSGADDYITKPIELEKLSSMIIMWLSDKISRKI